MGHFSHGASRERTHVLRYGFLTISGKTGGVRVEALARAAAAACANRLNFMVGEEWADRVQFSEEKDETRS